MGDSGMNPYVAAGIGIATGGIGVGVYYLLTRQGKAAKAASPEQFQPTQLSTQGSFIPRLIGRRRIGCLFAWASWPPTTTIVNQTSGGKGAKKKKTGGTLVYSQSAWHPLCIGPVQKLFRIWSDGKVIWDTELNNVDDPSGAEFTTAEGDTFRIYWGEIDQPIDDFLEDPDNVGISSRWPFVCHIVWVSKSLGSSPRWSQLDYEIEAGATQACFHSQAVAGTVASTTTVGSFGSTFNALGGLRVVNATSNIVIATEGWYRIRDRDDGGTLRNGIEVVGRTDKDDFTTDSILVTLELGGDTITLLDDPDTRTWDAAGGTEAPNCWTKPAPSGVVQQWERPFQEQNVYLTVGTWTARLQGNLTFDGTSADNHGRLFTSLELKLLSDARVGHSGARAMLELLTTPFPHGLGFSEDELDIDSFETVNDLLIDEGVLSSIYAKDGIDAVDVLSQIMQDIGAVLAWQYDTGKWELRAVRRETTASALTERHLEPSLPEVETSHLEHDADQIIYQFPDRDRDYRETSIGIDDDGQAIQLDTVRARKVAIPTVNDFASANIVAERNSQIALGGGALYTFKGLRDAKTLRPGDVITVPDIPQALRVVEVDWNADGGGGSLTAIPDHYGVTAVDFDGGGDGGGSAAPSTPAEVDLAATFFEVPDHVLEAGPPTICVLRIRDNETIIFADVHISPDGVTYQNVGREPAIVTGGELTEGITATDDWIMTTGPEFTVLGPDIAEAEDFSSDATSWRMGRQMCLIDDELFYLQAVTFVSGSTYRLDGLIRARFDTDRAVHAIGANVFIFDASILDIQDPALMPGVSLRVKTQPWASLPVSLASVTATTKTLYGKGIVPPAPCGVRVTAPRPGSSSYRTGEDVTFAWASRISEPPAAGIGLHGIGTQPVGVGALPANTTYEVLVYDAGDVLVRTEVLGAVTGWTYDNADLQADLGGETDFSIEVRQLQAGYRSDPTTLAITAI